MDIFVMQHNYRFRYLVTNDNEQSIVNMQGSPTAHTVTIYKYEKYKLEEAFLVLKPIKILSIFLGKNCICRKTKLSGPCDSSVFGGNAILAGRDDFEYNKYVFISEFEIINYCTEDKSIDFISFMGHNMIPTARAIGEKYCFFLSDLYKLIESERIEEGALIKSTNDSVDPYDYDVLKCSEGVFKTMECNQVRGFPRMKKLMRRRIFGELRNN